VTDPTASPNLESLEQWSFETRRVDKPWGYELIWALTDGYCGKLLHVNAGESLSLQFHEVKDEAWLIQSGRAKLELGALLDGLGGDRVGIVAFAGDAFVQCPLTTDLAAAKLFLRGVDPDAQPRQGTALAAALRAAGEVLEGSARPGRAKVVLVVSDGEDHEGDVASAAQALAAASAPIRRMRVGPITPRKLTGQVSASRLQDVMP